MELKLERSASNVSRISIKYCPLRAHILNQACLFEEKLTRKTFFIFRVLSRDLTSASDTPPVEGDHFPALLGRLPALTDFELDAYLNVQATPPIIKAQDDGTRFPSV